MYVHTPPSSPPQVTQDLGGTGSSQEVTDTMGYVANTLCMVSMATNLEPYPLS